MNFGKRLCAHILCAVVGCVLVCLGFAGILDAFWSGMGSALIAVSVLRFIRLWRYRKDEVYREQVNTEVTDERNHFLRNKAWAWAGYLFVLIAAVCTIVFKIMGQELLSTACSCGMCLIVLLYWIAFMILRKKY